jgi:hypothetical protein
METMRPPARFVLILLAIAAVAPAIAAAAPGPPPKTTGAYDVNVRGYYTGTGHAAVGAKSITITVRVKDEAGNAGNLVVPSLRIEDGRFSGTGTIMGKPVTLSGRIDAPDGEVVKAARLTCTLGTLDGKHARVVGSKKGL